MLCADLIHETLDNALRGAITRGEAHRRLDALLWGLLFRKHPGGRFSDNGSNAVENYYYPPMSNMEYVDDDYEGGTYQ